MASLAAVFVLTNAAPLNAQNTNAPPEVRIVWPRNNCADSWRFQYITCLKIKALANDPDGTIAQVQFFRDATLIGVATNAPFEIVWEPPTGFHYLKAVAFDNLGATSESEPVAIVLTEREPSRFEIKSPPSGSVFAAPGTFVFSAELLAVTPCTYAPVEFFAGTNSLGTVTQSGPFTVTTPLYSLAVTNLPEGNYQLYVRRQVPFYGTVSLAPGACESPVIRVTKLSMVSTRLAPDSRIEFEVVTSFPTNQNIIEVSSNLLNWLPISTNVPSTNTFTFTDPSPATNSPRYYRVFVRSP